MLLAVRGSRGGALFALGTGLVALAMMTGGSGASAAPDGGGFNLAQVTTIAPDDTTHIAAPSGDGTRLFIVGQQGRIRLFKNGTLLHGPVPDRPHRRLLRRARLLSIAFAPDYVTSGLFYVYYTAQTPDLGAITIDEFRRSKANPDLADPNSRREVLEIHHPRGNHNGGQLQFGPDGYLYIATGDGGGANDPDLAGQNLNVLLGKVLRIDPRESGFDDYTIPPDNPFYNQPPRSGEIWSSACAIPGASRSTARRVTWPPATSARTLGRDQLQPEGFRLWPRDELRMELSRGPSRLQPVAAAVRRAATASPHRPGLRISALGRAAHGLLDYGRLRHSRSGAHCGLGSLRLRRRLHVFALAHPAPGAGRTGRHELGRDRQPALHLRRGCLCTGVRRLRQRHGASPDSDDSASAAARLHAAGRDADRLRRGRGRASSPADPQGNDLNGGTLLAGTYTVQVDDTSTLHNFHLEGPGVQCVPPSDCVTDVAGFGQETWLVNFTPGSVTYHCDPHPNIMGSFTVVDGPRRHHHRHRRHLHHLRHPTSASAATSSASTTSASASAAATSERRVVQPASARGAERSSTSSFFELTQSPSFHSGRPARSPA